MQINEILDEFHERVWTFVRCVSRVEFVCDDRFNDCCVHVFRFLKQTFHVDAVRNVSASICVVIFSWIFLTCESYLNLMSSCIFNIFIEMNDFLMISLMLIIIVMLKRRWFLVKCINSYLIDVKRASCRFTHNSHST